MCVFGGGRPLGATAQGVLLRNDGDDAAAWQARRTGALPRQEPRGPLRRSAVDLRRTTEGVVGETGFRIEGAVTDLRCPGKVTNQGQGQGKGWRQGQAPGNAGGGGEDTGKRRVRGHVSGWLCAVVVRGVKHSLDCCSPQSRRIASGHRGPLQPTTMEPTLVHLVHHSIAPALCTSPASPKSPPAGVAKLVSNT